MRDLNTYFCTAVVGIILMVCTGFKIHAQSTLRDSINQLAALAQHTNDHDTVKLNLLIDTGKSLVYEHPDSSLLYFRYAVALAKDINQSAKQAMALNWTGVAHYILGEYNEALPYYISALRISETKNDHYGIATSLNHIGLIYESQGQHVRAIEQHKKAIQHAKIINHRERMASNYFNIGLAFDEMRQYDSAFYYLNICLELSTAANSHRLVSMSYNRLGETYFLTGDYKQAEVYYQKVLNYPEYKNTWERCFALAGLAQTYRATSQYAKSISNGLESYKLARAMDAKWEIIRVAKILSAAYADQRQFERAFEMMQVTQQLSDSVFNEEKEKELNFIHLKENELQNLRLEQQAIVQEGQLQYKNLLIIIVSVIGLSLIVIVSVLLARQRQKIRHNRALALTNAQIEKQNHTLNELNQTKSQLLSVISHDMRSPFLNLAALLKIMREDDLEPDLQQKFLEDLSQTVDTVSETMEDLLRWAGSQMEGLQTQTDYIDLDDVVESQIKFWDITAQKKNITIEHRKQALNAVADVEQIRTVIRNVLGNAIKFTNTSGTVSITYRQHAGMTGVVITDTGIGMTEDQLENLFVFNQRNRRRGTENEKGTGLGLMISKQFIDRNNGRIKVDSVPGKGTSFTIWLPTSQNS